MTRFTEHLLVGQDSLVRGCAGYYGLLVFVKDSVKLSWVEVLKDVDVDRSLLDVLLGFLLLLWLVLGRVSMARWIRLRQRFQVRKLVLIEIVGISFLVDQQKLLFFSNRGE